MKKTPIPAEVSGDSPAISEPWAVALGSFDRDLRRRAVSPNTRDAYAIDLRQFAAWASAAGSGARLDRRAGPAPLRGEPHRARAGAGHGGPQARRAARLLPRPGRARRTDREPGRAARARPSARSACRGCSRPPRSPALLDRIPATTPLELRDRALFELAYASGLRAEELVTLDARPRVDFDAETVRVEGKGGKTRLVPAGEHALRALERYLARGRPALEPGPARRRPGREPALFLSKSGRRLEHLGRPPPTAHVGAPGRGAARRRWPTPIRTRCGTRSPPICWRAARTCGRFRSCSDTRASRRRRSTLG